MKGSLLKDVGCLQHLTVVSGWNSFVSVWISEDFLTMSRIKSELTPFPSGFRLNPRLKEK